MLKQEEIKFEHLKPTSTDEQSLTQTFFLTPLKAIAFLRIYKITNYKFLKFDTRLKIRFACCLDPPHQIVSRSPAHWLDKSIVDEYVSVDWLDLCRF